MAGDVRASDSDRERVVDRLRNAAGEGRLDTDELAQRVQAAYAARTEAELDALLTDLPAPIPPPAPPAPQVSGHEVRERVAAFLVPNVVCIAVWLATGANDSFWPKWVLLFSGIAFAVWAVRAVLGVERD